MNLSDSRPKFSHVESFTGRDGSWHLPIHFWLSLAEIPAIQCGQNVEMAEWFDLMALPERGEVAHHGWALDIIEEACATSR